MLAIDTNILVRFLVVDDKVQAEKAKALLIQNPVVVATTVLMECDWVLRSTYGLTRAQAVGRLKAFASLPNVILQEPERVVRALGWALDGVEFADALHLAAAQGCDAFVSFDRKLAKAAQRFADIPIREP